MTVAQPFTTSPVPDDAKPFIAAARAMGADLGPNLSTLTDLEIAKFWVAESRNDAKALARIQATLAWRLEYDFDALLADEFADVKRTGKLYVLPQPSRSGCSILVWRSRLHMPDPPRLPRLIRFFVKTVWGRWKEGKGSDRIVVIVSRDGVEMKHRDLTMAREAASVFNAHFPEVLNELYVYPTNWVATTIWACVRPFLDPVTASKVNFISADEMQKRLADLTTPDNTPVSMGGTWEGEPVGLDPEALLKDEEVVLKS
ncbi:CRAL-TRIO domain-containing protein [Catenaria anguillulae PL171]|uniref:CRAL-TRIO domain-containing protein n=1 Tax=Catenaria anguillulae PL171 TaxID=765915 RepID=A0A1Y2HXU6_9FUNG|nr:CRAL-TRIO domain-containing protein [Catenaria anguillulae PL171]